MRRPGKSHPNIKKKEAGKGRVRVRIHFDRNFWRSRQFWTSWTGLTIAGTFAVVLLVGTGVFLHYWFSFERMMDMRLSGQVFGQAAEVLSAPGQIEVGQPLGPQQLVDYLQRAGYTEQADNFSPGWYQATGSFVEIHPSKSSYFEGANALRVDFAGGKVAAIRQLDGGQTTTAAQIEPVVITTLFGSSRVKRRVVHYDELPPTLIHAVMAAEDKRFFEEPGFDLRRIIAAALVDLRLGRKAQGASTITMQVARSFFFTQARTFHRKFEEALMALELEHHFTKQQIFDLYANQVYLGNRGSFAIHGFGEAAQSYFGKDIRDLDLAQDAFLAGIIRAPNHYATSDQHPDRAIDARDRVLNSMVEDGFVTAAQEAAAKQEPLTVRPAAISTSSAPYFVDLVRSQLLNHFSESDLTTQGFHVYTTLDPELQRVAAQAVDDGMKLVDQRLAWRYARWKKEGKPVPHPQVALVALDPQTGKVRALVGGRDYAASQYDHVLARRQPGSSFKPFVYAAAFLNGVDGRQPVVTPVTTVIDEPTTFDFDGTEYTPDNYEQRFFGVVTAKEALTHSLNVATVKIARMVGYDWILQVAKQMKLDDQIQATPAMALGAYDMTPLEVAAGYTALENGGVRAEPMFIRSVVNKDGAVVDQNRPQISAVLDPRVAFLVTTLMENVLDHGTGTVARQMGFDAPAAAKTGTSHDGWFAGYTSKLICIVWVGFDDNRQLDLAGAESAGPIWAEFMKGALQIPGYDNPQPFDPPSGVIEAPIDPESLDLATAKCPNPQDDYFIAGTQPSEYCPLHGGAMAAHLPPPASWVAHLFGANQNPAPPRNAPGPVATPAVPSSLRPSAAKPAAQPAQATKSEKKGFLQRFFGIFGGSKKASKQPPS
jgi:penicillin-binding protein 1B